MSMQRPTTPDILVFPEWVAVALYFVIIPLGLLVGYLAFRGFRRTDRRNARVLALGIILLTVVDTVLGTSIDILGLVDLSRATPLLRAVVQLLGVIAIVYAMYRPDRPSGNRSEDRQPDDTRFSPDTASDPDTSHDSSSDNKRGDRE
jgi:threonine/homoserine/homoserine lactone efflux protein